LAEALDQLARAVHESDENAFEVFNSMKPEIELTDFAEAFEVKPGLLAVSVDLIKGVKLLTKIYRTLPPSRSKSTVRSRTRKPKVPPTDKTES